jgi:hypothetical protein
MPDWPKFLPLRAHHGPHFGLLVDVPHPAQFTRCPETNKIRIREDLTTERRQLAVVLADRNSARIDPRERCRGDALGGRARHRSADRCEIASVAIPHRRTYSAVGFLKRRNGS